MCMVDDGDGWEVCRVEQRRAAKAHRCDECSRTIEPGENYEWLTGLFDGSWSTYRTCQHCKAVATWLKVVCGGYLSGGVYEDLYEHWNEGYVSMWLGRAILGMRWGWCRRGSTEMMKPLPEITSLDEAMRFMDRWGKSQLALRLRPQKFQTDAEAEAAL